MLSRASSFYWTSHRKELSGGRDEPSSEIMSKSSRGTASAQRACVIFARGRHGDRCLCLKQLHMSTVDVQRRCTSSFDKPLDRLADVFVATTLMLSGELPSYFSRPRIGLATPRVAFVIMESIPMSLLELLHMIRRRPGYRR